MNWKVFSKKKIRKTGLRTKMTPTCDVCHYNCFCLWWLIQVAGGGWFVAIFKNLIRRPQCCEESSWEVATCEHFLKFIIKNFGTSLAVQWLRLCASTAGGMVRSLVRELRSRMPCGMATKKIYLRNFQTFGKSKRKIQWTTIHSHLVQQLLTYSHICFICFCWTTLM